MFLEYLMISKLELVYTLEDAEEWGLKHIFWNFRALKVILLQEAQSYTEFKSFCKKEHHQHFTFQIPWYNLVSSAKLTILEEDMPQLISPIIIIKTSGPKTVPWGTPLRTGLSWLIPPCNLTKWVLCVKKWYHTSNLPAIPRVLEKFWRSYGEVFRDPSCQMLSQNQGIPCQQCSHRSLGVLWHQWHSTRLTSMSALL